MRKFTAAHRANISRAGKRRWQEYRRANGPPRHRAKRTIREARERNEARQCSWPGCYQNRNALGSYCRDHQRNLAAYGHPVAKTVRHRVFKPYVLASLAFVVDQLAAGHEGMRAAVAWVEKELADAAVPEWTIQRETSFRKRSAYAKYAARLLYAHRRGITAPEFVARFIAGEYADNRFTGEAGPHFASDAHARHQRALMLLKARSFGKSWEVGVQHKATVPALAGSAYRTSPLHLTPATREYIFGRWNAALGVLAIKATREIRQREKAGTLATPIRASGFTALVKRRRGEAVKVTLTPLQRQQRNNAIAAMVANGATPEQAGKAFGLHRTTVGHVLINGYPDVPRRPRYAGRPPKRQPVA